MDALADAADRAWRALARVLPPGGDLPRGGLPRGIALRTGRAAPRGPRIPDAPGARGRAAAWPVSQVLHAAALRGDGPAVAVVRAALDAHRRRDGALRDLPARPGRRGLVYHDDNAWAGLAEAQAALLGVGDPAEGRARAASALAAVLAGEDPRGGVRWREGRAARHACATAPGGLLAVRCGDAASGERLLGFVRGRLDAPGLLVADHLRADGTVEAHPWSYNTGATLALEALLGRADGAARRADAALARWPASALPAEPLPFLAVLARGVVLLDGLAGYARGREWLAVLARGVAAALDPATGWVSAGPVAPYAGGGAAGARAAVVDQAAAVQVLVLAGLPPDRAALVC